jgi:hypothetical protein
MKTHDVAQGSAEWRALRMGIPTASEFDQLVTPEFKPRTGQMPETFLYQKLVEKLLGYAPDFSAFAVEQGVILEQEAKPYYELTFDTPIQKVGFCTTDDATIGCSPDGLLGLDGGIEIKCPMPHTHLRYLMDGGLPKDYYAQVHGSMLVTGRPWWIFMSYSRQFAPLVVKVERDERIQTALRAALDAFLAKFADKLKAVQRMREEDPVIAEKRAAYECQVREFEATGKAPS